MKTHTTISDLSGGSKSDVLRLPMTSLTHHENERRVSPWAEGENSIIGRIVGLLDVRRTNPIGRINSLIQLASRMILSEMNGSGTLIP
jgi:hypothetical protein